MAQENYVEGCSVKRPPLLEPNGFCVWKARFETYVKSKDINLWQVIQNGDFYYEVKHSETKLMKETPYELLEDDKKKKLGKKNEAKMTLYNALPRKEYERVFMCKTAKEVWHTLVITHQGISQVKNCKIDLLTQEYENFSISNEETIDNGFTRFNAIVTSLKSLDLDYSSKNNVYEMVLDNDGVASKTINEKVKSLALKAKVTREQTSDDSDSQDGSDEDVDEEEEAEAFNLMARNFRKFFRKGNQFERGNRFGNGGNRFGKGHGNSFGNNDGENLYNYKIEGHFSIKCRKLKKNKAFVGGAWSNSEDGDDHQNKATCLMAIDSQKIVSKPSSSNYDLNIIDLPKENEELLSKINDLEIEVKKLANDKEVIEPCKKYEVLTKEVDSLKCNFSKLPDEALNFSKFKESSIALDDMLSHQKLSQDKEGLGFSKNYKIAFVCLKCDLRPDDWIVDSSYTNHMTGNRRLFTSYKAYDSGHVVFGSNLKGKVVGGGNITHDSITITNVEHVSGLAFNLITIGQL
ncbi:hypothetical protein Tco_1308387 [Tanacetum coccineum]